MKAITLLVVALFTSLTVLPAGGQYSFGSSRQIFRTTFHNFMDSDHHLNDSDADSLSGTSRRTVRPYATPRNRDSVSRRTQMAG